VSDLLCANCAYEIDEANEITGFCQTCQRAYEIGRERASI
jgi:hypothetical protein